MVASPRDVAAALVALAFSAAPQAGDRDWNAEALGRIAHPPLGLPTLDVSEQDTPGADKIAIGRNPRLSANGSITCAAQPRPEAGVHANRPPDA